MPFNLYFAGDKNKYADNYMISVGANRLLSQLLYRPHIKMWIERKSSKSKLFIDSGAFTAYTKGTVIDTDDYIEYINSITDDVTVFAQLDTIPGRFRQPKTYKDRQIAAEKSWENYIYMRQRVRDKDKLIPVFHQGEDYAWLKNMLDYRDNDGDRIKYIGVSPASDVSGLDEFLDRSFRIIANSSNPNVHTHAFGMTQIPMLEKYPYTSADSVSWKLTAAMGRIYTKYGAVYVSDRGKYEPDYIFNKPKEAQEKIIDTIKKSGYSIEDVSTKDYVRYVINIQFLMDWAENYEYKGVNYKTRYLL